MTDPKALREKLDEMAHSKLEKLLYNETGDSINESMRLKDSFYLTAFTQVALDLLARLEAAEEDSHE